jgi:hypothetical protein
MTNSVDKPPPAVGAYWIKEEDYPALLQLFDDGDKMPPNWKEWLKMAKETQGLCTRRAACLHRPLHIPGLVRRPWYKPGQHRTQKVRRGGGNREIWRPDQHHVLAGRRPISAQSRTARSAGPAIGLETVIDRP